MEGWRERELRDPQANPEPSSFNGRSSRLLPHLGVLAVLDVGAVLVPGPTLVLGLWLAFSLVYIAVILLRTRDAVQAYGLLSAGDRGLLKWSGVIAPLPLVLFLSAAYSLEGMGRDVNQDIFGTNAGWIAVTVVMEFGLIASAGAILGRGTVPHVMPAFLWRLLSWPLAVIYSLYTVATLTRGFGEALG